MTHLRKWVKKKVLAGDFYSYFVQLSFIVMRPIKKRKDLAGLFFFFLSVGLVVHFSLLWSK